MYPQSQRETVATEPPPVSSTACRTSGTWWSRHWVRIILITCGGTVVLFFGSVAFIIFGAFSMMRSSGACQEAVARVASKPAIVQALGSPIETGWFVMGTLDPGRRAEMTIPVSGPRGRARIYVDASKTKGKWNFTTLTVKLMATGEQISLVEK